MISARRKLVATLLSKRHLQQRFKSSSASFTDLPIPESIRNAVKSSILDEATKSDSTFWSNQQKQEVNGHHDHQYPNGSSSGGGVNGGIAVNGNSTSIHHSTTFGLDDPLDEWHLNSQPKYWPDIPPGVGAADPFHLTRSEIESLAQTIREDLLGTDHPVLNQAASYFFQADDSGGKKVRPVMVVLLARALAEHVGASPPSDTNQIWSNPMPWQRSDLGQSQRRLAEISEIIHTASLFHDDVIDEAETRRGKPAVHQVYGNKMAILAGDYLLARASISLARLRQVDVVECMSTIIEHLVRGEVMQMKGTSSTESRLTYYLRKNYFKTGSLMANSCRSAALLGNYTQELVDCSYAYGKHIGMAFQLVDDVLDFEGAAATMGKPALSDLNAGLATAPVLYALQTQSDTALQTMMDRKFRQEGDVDRTVELVFASDGLKKTKDLAQVHAELAMEAVMHLKPSEYRDALVHLAYKVVDRTR